MIGSLRRTRCLDASNFSPSCIQKRELRCETPLEFQRSSDEVPVRRSRKATDLYWLLSQRSSPTDTSPSGVSPYFVTIAVTLPPLNEAGRLSQMK